MPMVRDEHALTLGAAQETLEQPCSIRMRRAAENAAWRNDQRRALARMDELDRLTLFLEQHQNGVGAVHLNEAFAERKLLRRIAGRLHLHDLLLRQFLEIGPAERVHHRKRRGEDRAAIRRVTFDELAAPSRVE